MGDADPVPQWTMNNTLAEIGIHFPDHRERALAIGEMLGVYRDYPVSKGCTSPFAPIWINAIFRFRSNSPRLHRPARVREIASAHTSQNLGPD